jgi:hypothetical protein
LKAGLPSGPDRPSLKGEAGLRFGYRPEKPTLIFFVAMQKNRFPATEPVPTFAAYPPIAEAEIMLVERGLQVLNVEVVGDAYAIASNYLRKTGAVSDTLATNDRLLELIVEMFHRGEYNRIRLANKAISKFEAVELV